MLMCFSLVGHVLVMVGRSSVGEKNKRLSSSKRNDNDKGRGRADRQVTQALAFDLSAALISLCLVCCVLVLSPEEGKGQLSLPI